MMLLAVLAALGMKLTEAQASIQRARPQVDFPNAYRQSVVKFLAAYRERNGCMFVDHGPPPAPPPTKPKR
jgi:hypothetical protein